MSEKVEGMCSECGENPATDVDELCDDCGEQFAMAAAAITRAKESDNGR